MDVDLEGRWNSISKLYCRSSTLANPSFEPSKEEVSSHSLMSLNDHVTMQTDRKKTCTTYFSDWCRWFRM